MKIGMIGLGRMGANMAARLMAGGHEVAAFDRDPEARQRFAAATGSAAASLDELIASLPPPRVLWIMVPAGAPVRATVDELLPKVSAGDIVVDGGNSHYADAPAHARALAERGAFFVDVGTSGGIWGRSEGFALMVGGAKQAVDHLRPAFDALAPDPERGWGHVGGPGAGHFVKMIHNGIEYGLMQAYAEGFSILRHKEDYEFDLHQIAEIWRFGSVIRSWILDLAAGALKDDPTLADVAPYVEDSGEGRWTVAEAIALNVPAPVISQALIARLDSRDNEAFADRMLAILRNQFGGHAMKRTTGEGSKGDE